MKRTFVTSDTHGCYLQLHNCLVQANFDYDEDTLIHCGDIVDRGPDSKKVIDLLLQIKNLVALRGNHDEWMLEWINTGFHPGNWGHGGSATILSYIEPGEDKMIDIPETHKEFFRNQQKYYIDDQNRFFVHAGYNRDYLVDLQHESTFYWDRHLVMEMMSTSDDVKKMWDANDFSRVFFGHTPTINWKDKNGKPKTLPIYKAQYVQIDTGGCFKQFEGKITLLDITDDANHILYQS